MEPIDYLIALAVIAASLVGLGVISYYWLVAEDGLDEGLPALTYCRRCGCRHRVDYMRWTDNGDYRCCICCVEISR